MIYPRKDDKVLAFIDEFRERVAHEPFYGGYCWHFAHILKATFKRGEVCWNTFSHFVWVDVDNLVAYDINGIYEGEAPYYVPEHHLGLTIEDFLHIPGVSFNTTAEHIHRIKRRYEESAYFKCFYGIVSSETDIWTLENKYNCTVVSYCEHPTGNTHYVVMAGRELAISPKKDYNLWGADGTDYIFGGITNDKV